VTVLGTSFNVKAPSDSPEAEVILVSGRIAVHAGDLTTELTPGQRLTLDRSTGAVTALSQVGKGTMLRVSHSDLRVADVHAAEALRIVSDYFGKELVIEAGVWTDDRLNIELPIDATLEEAIRCLNALSDSATCYVSEERIIIEKKQKNN
jgi:ferric-dicitrate binding protein FerR (iron transport regulator)